MYDLFDFLKQSGKDSEVYQFVKNKLVGKTTAITERAKSVIKTDIKKLSEPTIYNWKIVMTFGSIIAILVLSFFIYITPIVESRFPNPLFKEIYGLYLFLLFFNLANAVYTITYYYYRISTPGMKGLRGRTGKTGDKGKNSVCQIDKKYTSTFVIDEKPIKREIKTILNLPPSIIQHDTKETWKPMEGNLGIRRFISGNGRKCLESKNQKFKCELTGSLGVQDKDKDNNTIDTNQPFNGVILDVDEKRQILS